MLKFNPFKSMTLQGTALAVGTYLWSHLDQSALSPTLQTVLTAGGTLWSVLGLRNAIAKR
jgi:hypothetical protein